MIKVFFFLQGCYEKVEEWLDDKKHLLGTIAMCVLVIQVGMPALFYSTHTHVTTVTAQG